MTLAELDAYFVRYHAGPPETYEPVEALADADGVMFDCPKCTATNGGPIGTHKVTCWFEDRVPDDVRPGPGRWRPSGNSLADLSFVDGRRTRSVALLGGCGWHGFVTFGSAD